MTTIMFSAKVKEDAVAEVEAAAKDMFAAIDQARPEGVRYASCKLSDGVTFVALLELEPGIDNPLFGIGEFRDFQEALRHWVAEPAQREPLEVIGSYRLFS